MMKLRVFFALAVVLVLLLLVVVSPAFAGGRIPYNGYFASDATVFRSVIENLYSVRVDFTFISTWTPGTNPQMIIDYDVGSGWTTASSFTCVPSQLHYALEWPVVYWYANGTVPYTDTIDWRVRFVKNSGSAITVQYIDIVDKFGGPDYDSLAYFASMDETLTDISYAWDQYLPLVISERYTDTLPSGSVSSVAFDLGVSDLISYSLLLGLVGLGGLRFMFDAAIRRGS